jgi:hypothetical protein
MTPESGVLTHLPISMPAVASYAYKYNDSMHSGSAMQTNIQTDIGSYSFGFPLAELPRCMLHIIFTQPCLKDPFMQYMQSMLRYMFIRYYVNPCKPAKSCQASRAAP